MFRVQGLGSRFWGFRAGSGFRGLENLSKAVLAEGFAQIGV